MSEIRMSDKRKQKIYVIRELTKREIKRKYARSFLGIAWSILSPLLNMVVITLIFSYMFSKSIENYPAYYFAGYIMITFFSTATTTAMTALKDNRTLMLKSKLSGEVFILSRVYTALVNLGFSCIAFIFVLVFLRINVTWTLIFFPVDVFFLTIFSIGVSYALSIWFVFYQDSRNVYSIINMILVRFAALFYSVDILSPGVRSFISYNPVYTYVKIARDCVIYGKISEPRYLIQMVAWSLGMFIIGRIIFYKNENKVMERL